MSEDIKNLLEIIELCKEELDKNDDNITATLDLQDLKSLRNIINDYKRQVEINQEHQKTNGELQQRIKQLEDADLTTIYLNGVYDERDKWKLKIKGKIEELKSKSGGNVFHIQQTINAEIRLLQELLEKEK